MDDRQSLSGLGVDDDVIVMVLERLQATSLDTPSVNEEQSRASLKLILGSVKSSSKAIAIKNDDLPICREAIMSVAVLIAGAPFASWAPVMIADLIYVLIRVRRKGIALTARQACLVRELRARNGRLPIELSVLLSIPLDSVLEELQSLASLRRRDGEVAAIVSEDGEGRWFVSGI